MWSKTGKVILLFYSFIAHFFLIILMGFQMAIGAPILAVWSVFLLQLSNTQLYYLNKIKKQIMTKVKSLPELVYMKKVLEAEKAKNKQHVHVC